MRVRAGLTALMLMSAALSVAAQKREVRGIVIDSATRTPLPGAKITIGRVADSTVSGALSDRRGQFVLRGVSEGINVLHVSYVGYQTRGDTVNILRSGLTLDTIRLAQGMISTADVLVTGRAVRVLQRGDTTEYNASAFRVDTNANADALVRQLPGVTMADGKVRAQGEQVDQILVDGQPFFGNDVTATLVNLPASIIDKVEIYDTKSDEAKETGIAEESTTKTMNIVTQEDKRMGYFGRARTGYGDEARYEAYGTISHFDTLIRATILSMSNNVNDQSFSFEDVLSSLATESVSGGHYITTDDNDALNAYFKPDRQGIIRTNSLGANVSTRFGKSSQASLNYVMSDARSDAASSTLRQYFNSGASLQLFRQVDTSTSTNQRHQLIGNLRYDIDSSTRFTLRPNASFDNASSNAMLEGLTRIDGMPQNATASSSSTDMHSSALSTDASLLRRFRNRRRSMTISLRASTAATDGTSSLQATGIRGGQTDRTDTTDQRGIQDVATTTWAPTISYNEPLSDNIMLRFSLDGSFSSSRSDRRTSTDPDRSGSYASLDTLLSNVFQQQTRSLASATSFIWSDSAIRFATGVRYQSLQLDGESIFPISVLTTRTFENVLPDVSLAFLALDNASLRFDYEASTVTPTIKQMQNVLNNSNPLLLSIGTPSLEQSLTHRLSMNYSTAISSINGFAYLFARTGYTSDPISTSMIIAGRDTIADGITLAQGAQLTRPVNLDKAIDASLDGYFSFDLDSLPISVNLNSSLRFDQTPSLINGSSNRTSTMAISGGASLYYRLDERFNASATFNVDHSTVRNTLQQDLNTVFTNVTVTAQVDWTFWEGLVLRADVSNRRNSGFSSGFGQNIALLNVTLAKKLFNNDRGELAIYVRDALNQNQAVDRIVQPAFTEDQRFMQLQRVAMVTFTYKFRSFGKTLFD
ncbi:MAG: hypothetical protein FGM24_00120 [Candidatus Kapabacteria bacterium]|nr:hypothetical protein [Candidatus Kapabacteria bacterium]